jgi:hypothetical protein
MRRVVWYIRTNVSEVPIGCIYPDDGSGQLLCAYILAIAPLECPEGNKECWALCASFLRDPLPFPSAGHALVRCFLDIHFNIILLYVDVALPAARVGAAAVPSSLAAVLRP